jgi:hypothetical protein
MNHQLHLFTTRKPRKLPPAKVLEHLLSRTVQDGDCWIWQGAKNAKGYGKFSVGGLKNLYVHRYVCEQFRGLRAGQVAMHSCDRPSCINPTHLRPASSSDNMRDAVAKGRLHPVRPDLAKLAREGKLKNARLRVDDIAEIRRRLALGEKQKSIADRFDVKFQAISKIKLGQRWSHVP